MRLRYTWRARADIDGIHDWISRHNPHAAAAVVDRIRKTAELLSEHPGLGREISPGSACFPSCGIPTLSITPSRVMRSSSSTCATAPALHPIRMSSDLMIGMHRLLPGRPPWPTRRSRQALSNLLNERTALTAMALRIEKAFGPKMDHLMRIQLAYDLAQARPARARSRCARSAARRDAPHGWGSGPTADCNLGPNLARLAQEALPRQEQGTVTRHHREERRSTMIGAPDADSFGSRLLAGSHARSQRLHA
jgi:hypothetical protein